MALVYRLEDKETRQGVYASSAMCGIEWDTERHPAPWSDGIKDFDCHDYFGFSSIEQMRKWFHRDEWLIALSEREIVLRVYEVDEEYIVRGYSQLVFKRHLAEQVNEVRPDSVLPQEVLFKYANA